MDVPPAQLPMLDVLDVLEMLPLNVVEENIWKTLEWQGDGQASLRQTSRRARRLVDELITSTPFTLSGDGRRISYTAASPQYLEAVQDSTIERWAAFLARLPRLTSIRLYQMTRSPQQQLRPINHQPLLASLVHSGVATQGRVRVLKLEAEAVPLTIACTACLAYPGLEELHIRPVYSPIFNTVRMDCRPWQDSRLTKVVIGQGGVPHTDMVVSLCRLSRLQHLEMTVTHLPDLQHLTRLTSLQHLSLCSTHGRPAVPVSDVACLFSLTRLTHLGLLTGLHIVDDQVAGAAPGTSCTALGQLQQLQSLHLCHGFVVHNSLFAGLALLSQLTELNIDRAELSEWREGHLPLLERLSTGGLRPAGMLRLLTPLLPLPSLTHLTAYIDTSTIISAHTHAAFDISTSDGSDAAAQAAALKLVAQHLAAAPRLQLPQLLLGVYNPEQRPGPLMLGRLSVTQVAEGLGPLGPHLRRLHLIGMALDDRGWVELSSALPCLERLTVVWGSLTDGGLAAIGRHMSSLAVLDYRRCNVHHMPSGSAWLGLARARTGALQVIATVSEQVQAQCAAEQERVHGRPNLVWRVQ